MQLRSIAYLALALAAAVAAAALARNWLEAQRAALPAAQASAPLTAEPPKPLPEVLVAAEDLPAGLLLRSEHLRWQRWPEDGVAANYMLRGQEGDGELLAGAVVRQGIASGQPVTANRLVRPGDRGYLAAMLAPGMRAVTVAITATTGIAGFVFPGDAVDLILTHSMPRDDTSQPRRASETVLREVRVLAIDQRTENQEGRAVLAKTATIEVDAKQAELVALAAEMGHLSLSLRSLTRGEDEPPASAGPRRDRPSYTLDSQISVLLPPAAASAAARSVTVLRGGKAEEVSFPASSEAAVR